MLEVLSGIDCAFAVFVFVLRCCYLCCCAMIMCDELLDVGVSLLHCMIVLCCYDVFGVSRRGVVVSPCIHV